MQCLPPLHTLAGHCPGPWPGSAGCWSPWRRRDFKGEAGVGNAVGWSPRFTSTLRIGCCRPSSGTQQALARQRRRDEGAENQLEKCSKSGRKEEAEHILPLVPPLCLAEACCEPELGRQQPILSVDVNLVVNLPIRSISRTKTVEPPDITHTAWLL